MSRIERNARKKKMRMKWNREKVERCGKRNREG